MKRTWTWPRAAWCLALLILAAVPAHAAPEWTSERLFRHVIDLARVQATDAWREPGQKLPAAVARIDYDTYRDIRFRPEAALWRDEARFEVQFFHPGFLFRHPVRIQILSEGELDDVDFDAGLFRYEGTAAALADGVPDDSGFAGFRLHYPINRPDYSDEVAVFLGASYFRLVGPGQVYGQSARGIAIDTAAASAEEFPAFRRFWLVRPAADASHMTVVALLDGPSLTGAYRFDIRIDDHQTSMDVDKRLFARADIEHLGVAPLTSMFLRGDASVRYHDDFRPRVHDTDGLLMRTSAGEWIWRPLSNPRALRVSSLRDADPLGFGLAQRERDFERYLDLEAEYHRRPSLWVEPLGGDWAAGGVELVEIPSDSETNDNIVAYWAPEEPIQAGDARGYRYRLSTFDADLPGHDLARVTRTRSGWGAVPGEPDPPPRSVRRFVVDFAGGAPGEVGDTRLPAADLRVSAGRIRDLQVRSLPVDGGWRATFLLQPDGDRPADMRLFLHDGDQPLTETWSHVWYPDEL